jgi:hypothetical protein
MKHPQPPFELEELTIAEIRRALALGAPDLTIREALAALEEADEVARRHEQVSASYRSYVEARMQRLAAAEEEAMDEVDREQQRSGRPWPSREDRFTARRDAGLEAGERFQIDEPLLAFADWIEAGAPERYRAETPVARAEGLLKRFGSVTG